MLNVRKQIIRFKTRATIIDMFDMRDETDSN